MHTLGFGESKRTLRLKINMEGLELEEFDKVLRRNGHEAAVRIDGCARMATVLPEEDATVFAEVQGVAVLLPHWIMFPQGEIHQLPVHMITFG